MAKMTFGLIEFLFTLNDLWIIDITASRHTKALHIQIYIFHILGRYIELSIRESHHTALINLCLPLTNFFRITAVRHTHIAGEAQFHRQIGMLGLIAGQSQAIHSFFCYIIATTANTILGIITLSGKSFYFFRIKCHHLPHTDMTQRNTYCTEKIFRGYLIGIPISNGIIGFAKFIFFTVGKMKSLTSIFYFQFTFGFHPINGLIM